MADIKIGAGRTHRAEGTGSNDVDVFGSSLRAILFDDIDDFFRRNDDGLALLYFLIDFGNSLTHMFTS
jgi:hypothetical protein